MDYTQAILDHVHSLDLPPDAAAFLADAWEVAQALDDAKDGDANAGAERAAWAAFVSLPANGFYRQHMHALQAALAVAVKKWECANVAEANGKADARSYMWRAGFYDLVLTVCLLVHGAGFDPMRVLGLYGETLAEYLEEFGNA